MQWHDLPIGSRNIRVSPGIHQQPGDTHISLLCSSEQRGVALLVFDIGIRPSLKQILDSSIAIGSNSVHQWCQPLVVLGVKVRTPLHQEEKNLHRNWNWNENWIREREWHGELK
jgi:hypothetical protein